jgi:succinate dehydrogenase flavin-adding protein (antitoxin of CptAB toxin-antitoxin module)
MDILDCVETWLRSLQGVFESAGVAVHFERTTDKRPKSSVVFNLRRGSTEADLVVWDSGEADLSTLEEDGSAKQEHFDSLLEPKDLALVLCRVAAMIGVIVKR